MVDAIVHAVASDDEVGVDCAKGAGKALGDVGSREGMGWLGEARDSLGRKA